MAWTVEGLIKSTQEEQAELAPGKWGPKRPLICTCWRCFFQRIREAILVLRGKLDTVRWPGGQ